MHACVKWKMVSYSISWYHFQVTVSDRAHLGPDGVSHMSYMFALNKQKILNLGKTHRGKPLTVCIEQKNPNH